MTKTLLSFGHGDSARALAKLLPDSRIIGTTRSAEKAEALRADGADALIWPGNDPTEALQTATHILLSIAPEEAGDPVFLAHADAIEDAPNLQWIGYLSTTGVYGDHAGGWVNEDTLLTPSTKRGQMRVKAEAQWQSLDLPLHIFRLAGIYGPGRGPFTKVRSGTARRIIKKGQVFSRTHVDDIAQVLTASIARPNPGTIYNVCDDDPAPPQDVIAFAAELLGLPVPPDIAFESADFTPMARSFYAESKRVRNDRITEDLRVKLRYASYRDGLKALLEDER
jgi:nucleoside-diphosphate-sugar epimerase